MMTRSPALDTSSLSGIAIAGTAHAPRSVRTAGRSGSLLALLFLLACGSGTGGERAPDSPIDAGSAKGSRDGSEPPTDVQNDAGDDGGSDTSDGLDAGDGRDASNALDAGHDGANMAPDAASTCENACALDERRCTGDRLEACQSDESGCLDWVVIRHCATLDQYCVDGPPRCADVPVPVAETCDNFLDDDLDGRVDCDDNDCVTAPLRCIPHGIRELFIDPRFDPPDLEGYSIRFTPNSAAPEGYTYEVSPLASPTEFPEVPGQSLDSSTLLAELHDHSAWYRFRRMVSFPFFGRTWTSFFVHDNGALTFFEVSPRPGVQAPEPRIDIASPARRLVGHGAATIDEHTDRIVVTYEDIAYTGGNVVHHAIQAVLHIDGRIDLHYIALGPLNHGTLQVGIANGGRLPGMIQEVDFR